MRNFLVKKKEKSREIRIFAFLRQEQEKIWN